MVDCNSRNNTYIAWQGYVSDLCFYVSPWADPESGIDFMEARVFDASSLAEFNRQPLSLPSGFLSSGGVLQV